MASTDIQYVADAATEALRDASLRVADTALHFGQVEQGSPPPHRTIRLLGPPLARACTFAASHSWIRVEETSEGADVSVDTSAVGKMAGEISIKSPTGEATVTVDVDVTARTEQRPSDEGHPGGREPLPVAAPASVPAAEASSADGVATSSTGLEASRTHREEIAPPQRHARAELRSAGLAGVAGSVLLLVSLSADYRYQTPLYEIVDELLTYLVLMPALILLASVLTLLPRTGRLAGPGILSGVVAASTWTLALLIADWAVEGVHERGAGFWLALGAHVILVLAACLAVHAMRVTLEVRLARRPRSVALPLLVSITAVASAVTLVGHGIDLGAAGNWESVFLVLPLALLWTAVIALAVPACAALVVPSRFGVWLLAGWVGGGAVLCWQFYVLTTEEWHVSAIPIYLFGLTLLTLLGLAVLIGRRPSDRPVHES